MRIANLIITLIVSLFLTIQSFAVMAAGSLGESFSESAADKQEAKDLGAGGGVGILVAILWCVAAALVIAKPKVSKIIFIVAAVFLFLGGTSGFSDLYFYGVASLAFALMAHFGVKEQIKKDEQDRVRYQADLAIAAQAVQNTAPVASMAPPSGQ